MGDEEYLTVSLQSCSSAMVWAEVALRGKKKLGSFYRGNYDTETARAKSLDQMQEFDKSVRHIQSLAKNRTRQSLWTGTLTSVTWIGRASLCPLEV